MARPKTTAELKDVRFTMMMKPSEVEIIEDWMFAHRLRSRAEAMRQLIELGLRSARNIGSAKLENELAVELRKRIAAEPSERPQKIWEDVCAERGVAT